VGWEGRGEIVGAVGWWGRSVGRWGRGRRHGAKRRGGGADDIVDDVVEQEAKYPSLAIGKSKAFICIGS